MKMTKIAMCVRLFCALACLLPMGVCPGGASCSDSEGHVDFGHAGHDDCCEFTHDSPERHFRSENAFVDHFGHECCQHCSDSPFHFGCGAGLALPNHTKSINFATFSWSGAVTNDAMGAKEELLPGSSGLTNAAIPILRTIILLT